MAVGPGVLVKVISVAVEVALITGTEVGVGEAQAEDNTHVKNNIETSKFLVFIFSPLILNWFEKNIIQGSLYKTGMDIKSIKPRGDGDREAFVNKKGIKFRLLG